MSEIAIVTESNKQKISDAIDEMVAGELFIQSKREHVNEIKKMIKEEYGLSPSLSNKLAKTRLKEERDKIEEDLGEFTEIYDKLFLD